MDLSRHWQITARMHRMPDDHNTRYAFAQGARAILTEVVEAYVDDSDMGDTALRLNDQIDSFTSAAINDRPKRAPVETPLEALEGTAPPDPVPTTEDALRDRIKALEAALEIACPHVADAAMGANPSVKAKADWLAVKATLDDTGTTGAQAADDARDAARWRGLMLGFANLVEAKDAVIAGHVERRMTVAFACFPGFTGNRGGSLPSKSRDVFVRFADELASNSAK